MKFYSNFEPLESFLDQKIDKLKGDLAGVTAIRKDLAGVEKDDVVSKTINEVVASYAAGDATRIDDHHHCCGGGFTPLDAGGTGDAGGVRDAGGAGGKYTSAAEEVRRQEDTPYRLDRSSIVGTSKVPSFACECLKCNENMNMLLSKIENIRAFYSYCCEEKEKSNFWALANAKKKAAGTPKMTADQPTERLPVNPY
ncbi:hypothetical protein HAX54_023613, partial [Datura stramonium]|nr:hypothetical protein [Datura stramonium]